MHSDVVSDVSYAEGDRQLAFEDLSIALAEVEVLNEHLAAKTGDEGGTAACPPVVEYSREVQARAAEELAALPNGSAVVEMMGDYAVIRDQARECTST